VENHRNIIEFGKWELDLHAIIGIERAVFNLPVVSFTPPDVESKSMLLQPILTPGQERR
jgi:hypothetical protein